LASVGNRSYSRDLCRNVAPNYWRTTGGFVGQGDDGACAGAAVMGGGGGAAVVFGAAPGFFAGLVDFFFVVDGVAGDNSTTTGFGRSLGGSPVDVIASSLSVSGW